MEAGVNPSAQARSRIQAPQKKAVEWGNGGEACGATYRKSRKQV